MKGALNFVAAQNLYGKFDGITIEVLTSDGDVSGSTTFPPTGGMTLNIKSCFKGLARSLRAALEIDPRNSKSIPSTKGSL